MLSGGLGPKANCEVEHVAPHELSPDVRHLCHTSGGELANMSVKAKPVRTAKVLLPG